MVVCFTSCLVTITIKKHPGARKTGKVLTAAVKLFSEVCAQKVNGSGWGWGETS